MKQLQNKNKEVTSWGVCSRYLPKYSYRPIIRVVPGFESNQFTEESLHAFFTKEYKVSNYADRMGYRIEGEELLRTEEVELLSSAVTFGTIQVPSGGQPIILMADRQTTGGYPRIGNVVSTDIPLLAQLKPGDYVSFLRFLLRKHSSST